MTEIATEIRNGARRSALYFMIMKSIAILVMSIKNWLMGHVFCIIIYPGKVI